MVARYRTECAKDRRKGLKKVLCAMCAALLLGGCATELVGEKADLTEVSYPAGMAIHPNGNIAYVVGSNFDLDYRATDGGALYVVDLEHNQILNSSKRIGSFGTNVVLSEDARRGYLVTRDDDALVWFEISADGRNIYCPKADEDSENLLKCRIILEDDPTHLSVTRSYRETTTYDSKGNAKTERVDFDLLMIAQLRNSNVTAVTVVEPKDGSDDYKISYETAALMYSAGETQWLKGEQFFITGRAATELILAEPVLNGDADVLGLHIKHHITVPGAYTAYEGRGMTLDPTKHQLYLINQYPNSVLRFNVGYLLGGDASGEGADAVAEGLLPQEMSKIQWVGDAVNGVLYITSVTDNGLYLVEPTSLEIFKKITVGSGPYDLNYDAENNILYILHFSGNDIWAYDTTDPQNPVLLKKYLSVEETAESAE